MFDAQQVTTLLALLGDHEEPLGIFYTDTKPEQGLTPRKEGGHACIVNYLRMVRKQRTQAWFGADTPGCVGGWVYAGFILPPPERIAHFVTTGLPNREGERYLPAPESMFRFFSSLDLEPAPARYCVVKPLSLFQPEESPLFITFFSRGEALTGLCQLAYFALDDHEAVALPFGAGCSNLLAWPRHYLRKHVAKAVVGGVDPSCRAFMGVDELTFTVSRDTFSAMLAAVPHSFLQGKTWASVIPRIRKSNGAWQG